MLDHSYPAVIRLDGLLLCRIIKVNLLELIVFGINGRPGVGVVEGAFTLGLGAVTRQLIVNARLHRRGSVINDRIADRNAVVSVIEDEALFNSHSALGAFKVGRRHLDFPAKLLIHGFGRFRSDIFISRFMVGKVTTDQTALRHINVLRGHIKKHDVFALGSRLAENHAGKTDFSPVCFFVFLQKFGTRDDSALFINIEL